ncbi:MAG: glycosyltransferase family 4 protein [Acidimicrobiales bacterium]
MRIALVANRFAPSVGGVQTHVGELSKGLAREGHVVDVFTHALAPTHAGIEACDGVTIRRYRRTLSLEHASLSVVLVRDLRARAHDYDVLHVHSYHDPIVAAAVAVWPGPIVFTPHYHGESESKARDLLHAVYRPVGRWLVARSDRIICVSPAERQLLGDHFPQSLKSSSVVSNGVHVEAIADAVPAILDDDREAIVVAGRLEEYKRVDRIIDAMPSLRDRFKLYVTGDGPDRERLAAMISDRGQSNDVRLLGRVSIDDLHGLLRSATVVCSASTLEAQGIVPLEGLAAGASVALSAIPAHRSIVDAYPDRAQSFGDDPAEVIAAITAAAAMRSRASSTAMPVSWGEVVRQTEAVYADACQAPGRVAVALPSA